MRKAAATISLAVFGLGLVSVVGINGVPLGIDFAGGTLLEVHFEPAVAVKDIRAKMADVLVDDKILDLSSSEIKQFGSENDILIRIAESETGTDVADGIKQVLKSGFASNIRTSWNGSAGRRRWDQRSAPSLSRGRRQGGVGFALADFDLHGLEIPPFSLRHSRCRCLVS